MTDSPTILVTGADQHQGLAIIRGLGRAGARVIACGPKPTSVGLYSRYTAERCVYTSPFDDKERFTSDILNILRRTKPDLVMPGVETTLVVLDEHRREIETFAPLAAPPSEVLQRAVDKVMTLELAQRLGVPTPATILGGSTNEILAKAARLRFPVAMKPRGNARYAPTAHRLDFKVRYARDLRELAEVLAPLPLQSDCLLVQECVRGMGVCVSGIFDHGEPVTMFPYARLREVPLSGGVSVLRQSIELDDRLKVYVTRMLGELGWHGVAMVEFKFDPTEDRFVLMEINPRFQASTALSLDIGINLPHLVACLYLGQHVQRSSGYRVGVRERWLHGDLLALFHHLTGQSQDPTRSNPLFSPPSKMRFLWQFLRDFRPGTKYDEFELDDWRPGLMEGMQLIRLVLGWGLGAVSRILRLPLRWLRVRPSRAPSDPRDRETTRTRMRVPTNR